MGKKFKKGRLYPRGETRFRYRVYLQIHKKKYGSSYLQGKTIIHVRKC